MPLLCKTDIRSALELDAWPLCARDLYRHLHSMTLCLLFVAVRQYVPKSLCIWEKLAQTTSLLQGKAALSFFACDASYAVDEDRDAAPAELRQLVQGLHDAGIEVLVQVRTSSRCFTIILC